MQEIVRRLRNRPADQLSALRESMPVEGINEAEEDEIPQDKEELDIPDDTTPTEDEEIPTEGEDEEEPVVKKEEPKIKSNNPLDNPYAVDYKIGDRITISYTNGDHAKMSGYIEGYDKLGFYRVKWDSGRITNGFTDATLSQSKDSVEEQRCVCGSTEFVNENNQIVCDKCGRLVEGYKDQLTLADKKRPKGKRMIRSEAHPVSTAMSNDGGDIGESIRKAFSKGKKKLSEESEYDEDYTAEYSFSRLRDELENEFWTRQSEMLDDIRNLGYAILDANSEYILIGLEDEEGEDHQIQIPVVGTSRTMTLDFTEAEIL